MTTAGGRDASSPSLLCRSRTAAGLTQEELAERAGLSVRSISDIERGLVSRPRQHSVLAIVEALGLDQRDRQQFVDHYRLRRSWAQAEPLAATVPAQLPPGVGAFAARACILRELDKLLVSPPAMPIAVLVGLGGIGKTALAVHWARSVRGSFPDGQLYLDLRGHGPAAPVEPDWALELLLLGLGVPAAEVPDGSDARSALLRSKLDGRRVLVVLDNASSSAQVRPLLPGETGCMVLVTSRSQLRGLVVRDGAQRFSVGRLTTDEGLTLLSRFIGPDRLDAEPGSAATVVRSCGGLPLALGIVADLVARNPAGSLAELADSLRDPAHRLTVLNTRDGDAATSVRDVFAWSYDALPAQEARFFRRLGLHPARDFGLIAAAQVAGAAPDAARATLELLVETHLVEALPGDRYRLHDLVHAYARERAAAEESEADRLAARTALCHWYLRTVDAAIQAVQPQPFTVALPDPFASDQDGAAFTDESALAWLQLERLNLYAVLRDAAAAGPVPIAWTLAERLYRCHVLRQDLAELVEVVDLALAAAAQAGDQAGQVSCHTGLGLAFRLAGDYQQAAVHLDRLLVLARSGWWPTQEAEALSDLGLIHHHLGRLPEAARCLEAARAIERQLGEAGGPGTTLGRLGSLSWSSGRLDESEHYLREALDLARQARDAAAEGTQSLQLARLLLRIGDPVAAEAHARHAVELFGRLGESAGESLATGALAEILASSARFQPGERPAAPSSEAVVLAGRSFDLAIESGAGRVRIDAALALGRVHQSLDDPARALPHFEDAQATAEANTLREPAAEAAIGLARALLALGRLPEAAGHAHHALSTARELGLGLAETDALVVLAGTYRAGERPADATQAALAAIQLATAAGDRAGVARATAELHRSPPPTARRTRRPGAAITTAEAS